MHDDDNDDHDHDALVSALRSRSMSSADENGPESRAEAPPGGTGRKGDAGAEEPRGFGYWARKIGGIILAQHIVIGMGLSALFGYLWPREYQLSAAS